MEFIEIKVELCVGQHLRPFRLSAGGNCCIFYSFLSAHLARNLRVLGEGLPAHTLAKPFGAQRCVYGVGMVANSESGESPLALKRRARRTNRALAGIYPDARCELDFRNAYELLVATVLSAQTTDVRVNQITPELFERFPGPMELGAAELSEVEQIIRPTGFFRPKARSLVGLGQRITQEFGGQVPNNLPDLVSLPGVGRKTANVVLGNVFNVPGLTVDTHFGRVVRRLGWTQQTDAVRVEHAVAELIERPEWTQLSHRLIFHGRQVCHSRRPACGSCEIANLCPSAGTI